MTPSLLDSLTINGRNRDHSFGMDLNRLNGRLNVPLGCEIDPSTPADILEVAWIAIGGSGKEVLARAIQQNGGRLPDSVHALAFDTDPDPVGLPHNLLVKLAFPHSDRVVKSRKRFANIDSLLKNDYRAGKVRRGSKQKRMVTAVIVIPYYYRRIRAALRKQIVNPFLKRATPGKRTRVVVMIVGSMGGGFGSGARDGIVTILRDLFRESHQAIDVQVECHALTPDVHRDVLKTDLQVSRSNANAVAWLLETVAAFSKPDVLPYRELGVQRPFACPIINGVRVYSSIDEHGKMLDDKSVYNMVATCMNAEATAAIANPNTAHLENLDDLSSSRTWFGGAGACRLTYPAETIERYAGYRGLRQLLREVSGHRLDGDEVRERARQLFNSAQMKGVKGRIESELAAPPAPTIPQDKNDRQVFLEEVRRMRSRVDGSWKQALAEGARELAMRERDRVAASVEDQYDMLIGDVSNLTPVDTQRCYESLLNQMNDRITAMEHELSQIEPAKRASVLNSTLDELERRQRALFRGQLFANVVESFKAYTSALKQQAAFQAAIAALSAVRSTIEAKIVRASAVSQAVQRAIPQLDDLANSQLDTLGKIREPFAIEAVDRKWVEETVGELVESTDWRQLATSILGKQLPAVDGRRTLQTLLEGLAANTVLDVMNQRLAKFSANSSGLRVPALKWLQDVADCVAPQFPFFEPNCFGEETYFSMILGVGSKQIGEELLDHFFDNFSPEVVETGDPNQIILFTQRQLVPMEAAFPNLDQMVDDYQKWLGLTKEQPQAEVHTTNRFAEMDLLEYLPADFSLDAEGIHNSLEVEEPQHV